MAQQVEQANHRSWKRIFGWSVVVILVGLPIFHILWSQWERHRLNQEFAVLRAAGEPVTPDELHFGWSPESDNASFDFRAAGDAIDTTTSAWSTYDKSQEGEYRVPLTDSELAVVHAIVGENSAALHRVIAARGKKIGGWGDAFVHPALLDNYDLKCVRPLCNLLKFAAMDAHSAGDDSLAIARLNDALNVADASENRPSMIAHLVAVGAIATASQAISQLMPQLHGPAPFPRQQLIDLQKHLENEQPMIDGNRLSWQSERISGVSTFEGMATGHWPGPRPSPGDSQDGLRRFGFLARPILLNNTRLYAQQLNEIQSASTAPDWPTAEKRMPKQLQARMDAHPFYYLLLRLFLPSMDTAVRIDYRGRAERRLAGTAVAIRLYAGDHENHLPTTLADLVPTYLPAVPIDALSGKPILYKADPPRIYSVGDDGVDDGGIAVDPDAADSFHRHHGDIVVYLVTQPRKVKANVDE